MEPEPVRTLPIDSATTLRPISTLFLVPTTTGAFEGIHNRSSEESQQFPTSSVFPSILQPTTTTTTAATTTATPSHSPSSSVGRAESNANLSELQQFHSQQEMTPTATPPYASLPTITSSTTTTTQSSLPTITSSTTITTQSRLPLEPPTVPSSVASEKVTDDDLAESKKPSFNLMIPPQTPLSPLQLRVQQQSQLQEKLQAQLRLQQQQQQEIALKKQQEAKTLLERKENVQANAIAAVKKGNKNENKIENPSETEKLSACEKLEKKTNSTALHERKRVEDDSVESDVSDSDSDRSRKRKKQQKRKHRRSHRRSESKKEKSRRRRKEKGKLRRRERSREEREEEKGTMKKSGERKRHRKPEACSSSSSSSSSERTERRNVKVKKQKTVEKKDEKLIENETKANNVRGYVGAERMEIELPTANEVIGTALDNSTATRCVFPDVAAVLQKITVSNDSNNAASIFIPTPVIVKARGRPRNGIPRLADNAAMQQQPPTVQPESNSERKDTITAKTTAKKGPNQRAARLQQHSTAQPERNDQSTTPTITTNTANSNLNKGGTKANSSKLCNTTGKSSDSFLSEPNNSTIEFNFPANLGHQRLVRIKQQSIAQHELNKRNQSTTTASNLKKRAKASLSNPSSAAGKRNQSILSVPSPTESPPLTAMPLCHQKQKKKPTLMPVKKAIIRKAKISEPNPKMMPAAAANVITRHRLMELREEWKSNGVADSSSDGEEIKSEEKTRSEENDRCKKLNDQSRSLPNRTQQEFVVENPNPSILNRSVDNISPFVNYTMTRKRTLEALSS
jgi:hypothetical protein